MQRTTLILRYGVGPVRARSPRGAARLLDVSRARVERLERRGVRSLQGIGGSAPCSQTGVSYDSLLEVYGLLTDAPVAGAFEDLPAPLEAGARLAAAGAVALEDDKRGAVAGARQAGGPEEDARPRPEKDEDVSSAGPSLGAPFADGASPLDDPLLLALLAIVAACLVSAGVEIRRALR